MIIIFVTIFIAIYKDQVSSSVAQKALSRALREQMRGESSECEHANLALTSGRASVWRAMLIGSEHVLIEHFNS